MRSEEDYNEKDVEELYLMFTNGTEEYPWVTGGFEKTSEAPEDEGWEPQAEEELILREKLFYLAKEFYMQGMDKKEAFEQAWVYLEERGLLGVMTQTKLWKRVRESEELVESVDKVMLESELTERIDNFRESGEEK